MQKSNNNFIEFRRNFQCLSQDAKIERLKSFTSDELALLYEMPELFLYDKQLAPPGNWRYHLFMAGRGSGKTFAGTSWLYSKIINGAQEVGIMGPDYATLVKDIQPTFESHFPPNKKPKFNGQYHYYNCHNGCIVKLYTSDQEVRGANLEFGYTEEICKWCDNNEDKIKERYDLFDLAVRRGSNPQIFNASTPKNQKWFRNFTEAVKNKNPLYSLTTGSTFDNIYLSPAAKAAYKDAFGGNLGRQELDGELILETPGAYWTHDIIEGCRAPTPIQLENGIRYGSPALIRPTNEQLMGRAPIQQPDLTKPYLVRIIIGFDPAGSSDGDECGIVIVALFSNKQAWILEDASGSYNPDQYARLIDEKYRQYSASAVVVESNFGGKASYEYILRSVNANMKIIPIHSKQGKTTRAEHISALYSQGKVHHAATFKQLEDQMCNFNVHYTKSPDRLDALGFALTELFWPVDASGNKISVNNMIRIR